MLKIDDKKHITFAEPDTKNPYASCISFFICQFLLFVFFYQAIVVYDGRRNFAWRSSHPTMYPDPNFATPNILGHRFTLMDGIVGLALDSYTKVLYFQPLATDR